MFHASSFKFYSVFLSSLFSILSPLVVEAAQIYLLPHTQSVHVGDTLISELRLNTEGEQINAFDIKVLYPKNIVKIQDVTEGGSFANLWIRDPSHIEKEGSLLLEGGTTEGFSGDGLIVKIVFKALKEGGATITFAPTSQVLLHDGRGTQTLGIFSPAEYSIGKKVVPIISLSSGTHPEEDVWYRGDAISVSWEPEDGYVYSYVLSHDIIQNPDDIPEKLIGTVNYDNPTDGVYYFSIVKSKNGRDYSGVSRRRILNDKTMPREFDVLIGKDAGVLGGNYFATFRAQDAISGISRYEIKEYKAWTFGLGGEGWKPVESPYPLGDQKLRSILKVKAIDEAGNEQVSLFVPLPIRIIQDVLFVFLTGAILFFLRKIMKNKKIKRHA